MEVDLTMDLREWHMKAVKQFGWSKTVLTANIAANAPESIVLSVEDKACYIMEQKEKQATSLTKAPAAVKSVGLQAFGRIRKLWLIWKEGGRRRHTMLRKLVCEE